MADRKYIGPERRKYLRITRHRAIKYTRLSRKLQPIINLAMKTHTKDLSAAGVRFFARKKIPVGSIVEFQFKIPKVNKSVAGIGKVVRSRLRYDRKTYDIGFKFAWVQRKNAAMIDDYVRVEKVKQILRKLGK